MLFYCQDQGAAPVPCSLNEYEEFPTSSMGRDLRCFEWDGSPADCHRLCDEAREVDLRYVEDLIQDKNSRYILVYCEEFEDPEIDFQ